MAWWIWALLGLALAAFELLTPGGFYVIFFGLSGLVVALLAAIGFAGPLWLQILLFSVCSVVSLLLFRNPLLRLMAERTASQPAIDTLVGETAVAATAIESGELGKAELRGTVWNARNGTTQRIDAGRRCRVTRVEGLVIWIQPE